MRKSMVLVLVTGCLNKPAILSFFEGEWELAGKMLTAELQQSGAAGQRLTELIDARDLARVPRFAGEGEIGRAHV